MENGMKLSLFDVISDPLHPQGEPGVLPGQPGQLQRRQGKPQRHSSMMDSGARSVSQRPSPPRWTKIKPIPYPVKMRSLSVATCFWTSPKRMDSPSPPISPTEGRQRCLRLGDRIRRACGSAESFYTISGQQLIRYSLKDYEQSGSVAL